MKRLCGVNPPVITIFDEHHKVDIEASKRQADFLISKGVDGLAYLGTSGEFSIMTVEEKKNFINEMIKYVNGRVNVIVGVGDTCLENTMDLLKFVEQAGADGVLLMYTVQTWLKHTLDMLLLILRCRSLSTTSRILPDTASMQML